MTLSALFEWCDAHRVAGAVLFVAFVFATLLVMEWVRDIAQQRRGR